MKLLCEGVNQEQIGNIPSFSLVLSHTISLTPFHAKFSHLKMAAINLRPLNHFSQCATYVF